MNKPLLQELLKLSPAERIDLIDELWDSIPPIENVSLTDAQAEEIDRRIAEHERDPSSGIPWEEVRAWLWSRRKRSIGSLSDRKHELNSQRRRIGTTRISLV